MDSSKEVMELIENLYTMVTEAWGVPLGNDKCIVEREKVLELLNDIKTSLPVELAEAKRLVSARDEFIGNAKREAESIRKSAEDRARSLLEEQEIVRVAKAHSVELVSNAEYKSKELRRVANEYVDEILRRTEESVSEALKSINQSRASFRSLAGAPVEQMAAEEVDERMAEDEIAEVAELVESAEAVEDMDDMFIEPDEDTRVYHAEK